MKMIPSYNLRWNYKLNGKCQLEQLWYDEDQPCREEWRPLETVKEVREDKKV